MDFTLVDKPNIGAVISTGLNINNKQQENDMLYTTSMSYHELGKYLYVSTSSSSLSKLHIIDCLNGKLYIPSLKNQRENIQQVISTYVFICLIVCLLFFNPKGFVVWLFVSCYTSVCLYIIICYSSISFFFFFCN